MMGTVTPLRRPLIFKPDPVYGDPLTPEAKAALATHHSVDQQLQRAGAGNYLTVASCAQMRRLCIEGRRALFLLERSLP